MVFSNCTGNNIKLVELKAQLALIAAAGEDLAGLEHEPSIGLAFSCRERATQTAEMPMISRAQRSAGTAGWAGVIDAHRHSNQNCTPALRHGTAIGSGRAAGWAQAGEPVNGVCPTSLCPRHADSIARRHGASVPVGAPLLLVEYRTLRYPVIPFCP